MAGRYGLYNNSATAENVTLYIVSNSNQAYTTLPELVKPKSRSIMIEYDRPAKDYEAGTFLHGTVDSALMYL